MSQPVRLSSVNFSMLSQFVRDTHRNIVLPSEWLVFTLMVVFIGLVSVYDGYLVYAFRESILHLEQNPLGVQLIQWNSGDVSLFLAVKAFGTTLCLLILAMLYRMTRRLALPVVSGVAMAQLGLLGYLTY